MIGNTGVLGVFLCFGVLGKTLDSMLIELRFFGDDDGGNIEVTVVPALQKGATTTILTDLEDKEKLFSHLEDISINVEIDENGIVSESR